MQGHVDGTGTVRATREEGFSRVLEIELEPRLARYLVEKGSVALDGVSLTVSALSEDGFSVSLIPETLAADESRGDARGRPCEHRGRHPRQARRAAAGRHAYERPPSTTTPFATIEQAIEDIRQGKMVVVCDDEDRENEGDLTLAAQFATPEAINFMAKEGRGLICLSLTPERCDELGLDLMAAKNESAFETPFTVSIEAREGVTTGISAHDRAHTIQVAIDPESRPRDLVQPGHVFPLKSRAGGVLERAGQTEAAVDLARLAGLNPAGVICEVMNDDGTMARVPDLVELLRAARAEHDHGRRPDRLPPPPRQARRTRRLHAAADHVRRLRGGRLPLAGRRQAPRGARQGRGQRAGRTCSCGCTRSASPATCSTRCAATAASSSNRPCR